MLTTMRLAFAIKLIPFCASNNLRAWTGEREYPAGQGREGHTPTLTLFCGLPGLGKTPPQGYLWVIQQACRPDDLQLEAAEAERLWRAASGAAHGMYWTNLELTEVDIGEEYEPGQFRTFTLPDAHAMLQVLRASERVATYAALKYVLFLGEDPTRAMTDARGWLAEQITLRDDADSDVRRRLADDPIGLEGELDSR